jgi:hypothetical protein
MSSISTISSVIVVYCGFRLNLAVKSWRQRAYELEGSPSVIGDMSEKLLNKILAIQKVMVMVADEVQ